MKMVILKISVILFFIGMILMNYLANSLPLNGVSTGQISARYNTMFTPAGVTFSIWGLIYILLAVFVVIFVMSDGSNIPNMELLGILFLVSCVFNVAWLFTWHFDKIILSVIVMVLFLLTLLAILKFVKPTGLSNAAFSVYAGWVSVALIANISILLFKYDISIFMSNEKLWLYVILGVSLLIGGYMVVFQKNYYYGAVFIWAYIGIAIRYLG
ncbi:tryptophan-rich sensory protein [Candidatus Izemoplasma sp. B36]|uniref:tryptophan-rich sensory protein n=1 Tax=Candidatus Izemoplasma sp. B36 TaxID=3242468 RepID=UPI0035586B8B